jgi:hypothetical protein
LNRSISCSRTQYRFSFLALVFLSVLSPAHGGEDDIDVLWGDTGDDGSVTVYHPPPEAPPGYFTSPSSGTVWEHGEPGVIIGWTGFESDTVKIELFRNGEKIADLTPWMVSSGSFTRDAPIASTWGSGRHFTLVLTDDSGRSIESDEFLILSPFSVISPGSDSRWSHGPGEFEVRWTSSGGSEVLIELCYGEDLDAIASLSGWITDTGSFSVLDVSSLWGTGDEYAVRITDDLGNYIYGDPFSIQSVRIDAPSPGTDWLIGEPLPAIEWSSAGSIVTIELWEENAQSASVILAVWIPNTGDFVPGDGFDQSMLDPEKKYFVRVITDLGGSGDSELISPGYSDNLPQGAVHVFETADGSVDYPGDSDLWLVRVPAGRMGRIEVSSVQSLDVRVYRAESGNAVASGTSAESITWYSADGEDFLVQVSADPDLTGVPYSVFLSDFPPSAREHRFRVSLYVEGALGDYEYVVTDGGRLCLSWFPKKFLEVGLEAYFIKVNTDIFSALPCESMDYLGLFVSLHKTITGSLGGYGGLSWLGRKTDCQATFEPEYEDYAESLDGGLFPYAGLEYRILGARSRISLYAALRYLYVVNTEGVLDLGLQVGF